MEHLTKMGYNKVHTIDKCISVASTTLPTRSNMSQISSYTLQYSKKQTVKQIFFFKKKKFKQIEKSFSSESNLSGPESGYKISSDMIMRILGLLFYVSLMSDHFLRILTYLFPMFR